MWGKNQKSLSSENSRIRDLRSNQLFDHIGSVSFPVLRGHFWFIGVGGRSRFEIFLRGDDVVGGSRRLSGVSLDDDREDVDDETVGLFFSRLFFFLFDHTYRELDSFFTSLVFT